MAEFFEIDFLPVHSSCSGDAVTIRYRLGGETFIHVVDGGYVQSGPLVVDHIRRLYDDPAYIDHVVVTHGDGDHAGGLRSVLEKFAVGTLWMLRPWIYAEQLLPYFPTYTTVHRLRAKLRSSYPSLVELETIASDRGIPIAEPFTGKRIGAFTVLAPSPGRFGRLVLDSEKTPEASTGPVNILERAAAAATRAARLIRGAWGHEIFSPEETSAENEMSVVQAAVLSGVSVVLTGDAGRAGLAEAADHAWSAGLALPGVDLFQIPHHGSRRNVSTEILDRWLGPRLAMRLQPGQHSFLAVVCAAPEDADHPRPAVVRAVIHRGGELASTEDGPVSFYKGLLRRPGWGDLPYASYPNSQDA